MDNEKKIAKAAMKRTHLTRDEVQEICQMARDAEDYRAWAAFVLGFNHGFRVSELAGGSPTVAALQMQDIDIKNRRINTRRLKGSVDDRHDLVDLRGNPTMSDVAALKAYFKVRIADGSDAVFTGQKGAMQRQTLNLLFKDYAQKVSDARQQRGLPSIPEEAQHFHVLRHSIGTLIANDPQAGIFVAKNHLGHAAISSTQIYAHPDSRATALAVKRVLANAA